MNGFLKFLLVPSSSDNLFHGVEVFSFFNLNLFFSKHLLLESNLSLDSGRAKIKLRPGPFSIKMCFSFIIFLILEMLVRPKRKPRGCGCGGGLQGFFLSRNFACPLKQQRPHSIFLTVPKGSIYL